MPKDKLFSVSVSAFLFFLLWQGGAVIGTATKPEVEGMRLVHLSYDGGEIHQEHEVFGTDALIATWAAEIMRGTQQLCSGGGMAPYEGSRRSFTPSAWTGGACPDLQNGDQARAVWEFWSETGIRHRVFAEVTVIK